MPGIDIFGATTGYGVDVQPTVGPAAIAASNARHTPEVTVAAPAAPTTPPASTGSLVAIGAILLALSQK